MVSVQDAIAALQAHHALAAPFEQAQVGTIARARAQQTQRRGLDGVAAREPLLEGRVARVGSAKCRCHEAGT